MEKDLISKDSRVVFVNDGSSDNTWEIIEALHSENPVFQGIKLSRNRGHQNAIMAGMMVAREYADIVITIDADLQQDIEAVDEFIAKYYPE